MSLANIPICVGERRYTRFGFRDLIAAQAVDMIMPDVVRAGGIAETKKIAAGRKGLLASAHQTWFGLKVGDERSGEIQVRVEQKLY